MGLSRVSYTVYYPLKYSHMNNTNKKIIITALLAIAAIIVLVIVWNNRQPEEEILTETTVTRPEINLAFKYKIGENGYSLSEAPREASSTDSLLNGFVLKPVTLEETPVGGETEPVISIFVIEKPPRATSTPAVTASTTTATTTVENEDLEDLKALATQYKNLTGIEMAIGDLELVEIDGVDVLHYTADGLYLHDTYIADVFGNIYLFVGQYIEEDEKIHQDFKELMNSVSFG